MTTDQNIVKLHRVLRAQPEKIYRAFLEADAMEKWLPPYGLIAKVHQFEPRVGGTFKMSFINFGTSRSEHFGGTYLELRPNERIRYTDRFEAPHLAGDFETTISLRSVSCGTELQISQNVPGDIPAELCYLGWQESLSQLAHLVEPEIPDRV
jgi:uncharacterized protein YndB with AHSA1/START domain